MKLREKKYSHNEKRKLRQLHVYLSKLFNRIPRCRNQNIVHSYSYLFYALIRINRLIDDACHVLRYDKVF